MDSDDKIVVQVTQEKKRLLTELQHLQKAQKSGIVSQEEYATVKNSLERKIKNLDKKLKQAEAKQKAVQEIIGAESMLLVSSPKKKHQKYFAKIDKHASAVPEVSASRDSPTPKVLHTPKDTPRVSSTLKESPASKVYPAVQPSPAVSDAVVSSPVSENSDELLQEDTNWRFALIVLTLFLVILLYIKFSSYGATSDVLAVDAYLDYASSYSRDMHDVLLQLNADYGSSLLITYHLVGETDLSTAAAHAVFCADQQGRRQEYQDYIFMHYSPDMVAAASSLNLDTAAFDICMNTYYDAQEESIEYTPTLYVNNKKIVGAVGYDTVKTVIDAEMTALG